MEVIYLIAEGVQDVALLAKWLHVVRGYRDAESLAKTVLGPAFMQRKPPTPTASRTETQPEVGGPSKEGINGTGDAGATQPPQGPAKYLVSPTGILAILRAAEGNKKTRGGMDTDLEALDRDELRIAAAAVICDSDAETKADRGKWAGVLRSHGLPEPSDFGAVIEDTGRRTGFFAMPGGGSSGALETVLLQLAQANLPTAHGHARGYVDEWLQLPDATAPPHTELAKPMGPDKATVAAMGP
jgi:hypothetical protein